MDEKNIRSRTVINNVAKSLFWNILPASPFGSRFCGPAGLCHHRNFSEINILPARPEKNLGDMGEDMGGGDRQEFPTVE
jgi:hypothetical protein